MKKYEKIYKQLKKEMAEDDIADYMLIPKDLTEEELKKSNEEIKAFRFKLMRERTEAQRIYSELLRFKFLLENYINKEPFASVNSFGKSLGEYVRILNRTKKSLSEDLDVHYTRFSRLINDREEPNVELMYRLEKHSGNLIPAIYWWKLVLKKQEFNIKQDSKTRKREGAKVRNGLNIRD